ncbi:hypothetical protein [Clostridium pasteurianum]|uniref:Uncharacterized protein n=1 Tax=Clostridium pasteurianum BC1 TaxID=86416 RepID=R4K1V3_CLOPA|nr:hypothetical protein [Clostridium pasteurianum]AGK97072.1 hypothetical protein Clopa_2195 [Clostridium pasteurianum BC1]
MRISLESDDIKKLRGLITSRIDELRYDISDEMQYGEDEVRKVIREYKALLKKIDEQIEKAGVIK